MKKILLASTILVASASFAAADNANISISGDAEFGMVYTGAWAAYYGAGIDFAMSSTTDGGLEFGATVGFDANDTTVNDTSVWISGAFGKLAVGDVDNAIDATVGGIAEVVSETGAGNGLDDDAERFRGLSAANVLYTHTFGDFDVAASFDTVSGNNFAAAGKYNFGDYNVAAGVETDGTNTHAAISAGAKFGDFGVNALYATALSGPANSSMGLDASYTTGAVTVTAGVGQHIVGGTVQVLDYGLGVAYDLGGGAVVDAGVASVDGTIYAEFGIGMKF